MNKEIITKLLQEKLAVKLAEKKKEVAEKLIKESASVNTTDRYIPHPKRVGVKVKNPNYKDKDADTSPRYEDHPSKVGVKVKKEVKESTELQEDHFSEDELEKILAKFEKDLNHDGAKAVEDYINAEADGNKAKAAMAAGKIKRAMKK